VIERIFVLSEGATLDPALLPAEMLSGITPARSSNFKSQTEAATRGAEKQMIVNALNETNQNRTRAAKSLGISRRTLQNKIKELDL
jgi:two-component system response regulator HydG